MRRTTRWVAVLWFLCPLGAQDQPAQNPSKTEAVSRLEQLNAEQAALFAVWRAKVDAQSKAAEQAKADGLPVPAMPMRPDFGALHDKYVAAARDFPGVDAVPFLLGALDLGGIDAAKTRQVLDEILDHHLDSPRLAVIGGMVPYLAQIVDADYAKSAIARIEQHGKNPMLLGWVAFARFEKVRRSEPVASPAFREAKAVVATAVQKAGDENLLRQFDSLIAELEKFGIGMVAPDIKGIDLDGVAFELSDYQGKVVLLDFWGDW